MSRSHPDDNQSLTWSDDAVGATEFLFADYRDFVFPLHLHETFAIGVIEAGGQLFHPGRSSSFVMPAGTLCAINPGVVHEGWPATERGWRYRMFYPSPALVSNVLDDMQHRASGREWGLEKYVINDSELYSEFVNMHTSSQRAETSLERQTRIAIFLRRLFARHGNFLPEKRTERTIPRTANTVRDYLHAMSHHQIGIADLARAAGVSETQVIRAFTKATGMPPHAYLVSLRVERAKALLRSGIGLAQAALEIGFLDQSQFTRHFKRLTGVTPGRFNSEILPAR